MLKTGHVPVSDQVSRLPNVSAGESKFPCICCEVRMLIVRSVKGKAQRVEEDDEEEELRKLQAEMAM